MAPLVQANQFRLNSNPYGNLVGGLQQGLSLRNQFGQSQRDAQQADAIKQQNAQQQANKDRQFLQNDLRLEQDQDRIRLQQDQFAQQQAQVPSSGGISPKQKLAELKFESEEEQQKFENDLTEEDRNNSILTGVALSAVRMQDPQQVRQFLTQQAGQLKKRGRTKAFETIADVLQMPDDQMMSQVMQQAREGQTNSKRYDELFKSLTPTTRTRELMDANILPGTPEFKEAIIKGRSGVTVNTGRKFETSEQKRLGAAYADQVVKLSEDAGKAQEQLSTLGATRNIDVKTGALEPLKLQLARFAEAFGLDSSGITNIATAEAYEAQTTKMVNDSLRMNPGVQTDGDAIRARKEMVALEGHPKSNEYKLNVFESIARRKIEQSRFVDERMDAGLNSRESLAAWRKFINKTPAIHQSKKVDGLPYFYYQFEDDMREFNPDMSKKQLMDLWESEKK